MIWPISNETFSFPDCLHADNDDISEANILNTLKLKTLLSMFAVYSMFFYFNSWSLEWCRHSTRYFVEHPYSTNSVAERKLRYMIHNTDNVTYRLCKSIIKHIFPLRYLSAQGSTGLPTSCRRQSAVQLTTWHLSISSRDLQPFFHGYRSCDSIVC